MYEQFYAFNLLNGHLSTKKNCAKDLIEIATPILGAVQVQVNCDHDRRSQFNSYSIFIHMHALRPADAVFRSHLQMRKFDLIVTI